MEVNQAGAPGKMLKAMGTKEEFYRVPYLVPGGNTMWKGLGEVQWVSLQSKGAIDMGSNLNTGEACLR